jgi:hypothetical protein
LATRDSRADRTGLNPTYIATYIGLTFNSTYLNLIKTGQLKMKKNIIASISICTSIAAVLIVGAPARADSNLGTAQNTIGPSVAFGSGQSVFGVDSKFGINDNVSLRPFVYFPTGGTNYGTAITYDIKLLNATPNRRGRLIFSDNPLTPFVGASVDVNTVGGKNITTPSFVGGADLALNESIQLKGQIVVPFNTDRGQATTFTVGAGLRF